MGLKALFHCSKAFRNDAMVGWDALVAAVGWRVPANSRRLQVSAASVNDKPPKGPSAARQCNQADEPPYQHLLFF